MNEEQKGRIIDAFLHELGHPHVVAITFWGHGDITLQLDEPHPDFAHTVDETDTGVYFTTTTVRKGLVIDMIAILRHEVAA